jgi:putative ABC transport system permease protein
MRSRISWLDLKLGFRMLVKYPGLTLIGGLAIAFAVCVGVGTFEILSQLAYPTIPLPEGDRIVAVRNWDALANEAEPRALHDLEAWRAGLRTVEEVGEFRTVERNLVLGQGHGEPLEVAEISPVAFRLTRVPPLLGRPLQPTDERPDAPPVLVLGHDEWQRHFGGDPAIVGRTVRLGRTEHTVVGVMPDGYRFPVSHGAWVPLRASALEHERREGPAITVFGRLAPGTTLEEAQAELTAVGRRAAAEYPETHEHLRPQVLPYTSAFIEMSGAEAAGLMSANIFLVMLLVLVCGNVALLMFARAVSREGEIVVRNALGASRGRIIGQLFAEALVLAGVAALVGLAVTDFGLRQMLRALETAVTTFSGLPFWISDRISTTTLLYAGGLTILGALVAGVVPALKVTRGLSDRLRQASAGGGGYRFGGVWTAVIVAQVAVTVTFPAIAFHMQREASRVSLRDIGFPTEQYLAARLEIDGAALAADAGPGADRAGADRAGADGAGADSSGAARVARVRATAEELERRLEADPAVLGVAFAERLPRMSHPSRRVELDEGGAAPVDPGIGYHWASVGVVAPDFFSVVDAPIVRGRGFHSGDLAPDARVVIVNQSFVDRVLGGRNPIGRHVRYVAPASRTATATVVAEPWYEIVGVVPDLGMAMEPEGLYHPIAPGTASRLHVAVRVRGTPASLVPRLRDLAMAVDPTMRLHDVMPLDAVDDEPLLTFAFVLIVLVSAVALLLSLAAIYAVMSFTVARRTREIGIRIALGADARRLVLTIFRRPLIQVTCGIVVGGLLVAGLPMILQAEESSARGTALVGVYSLAMLGICLLACVVPTRRALRVEPTEALRAE